MDIAQQLTLLAELSRIEAKIREARNRREAVPAAANAAREEANGHKKTFDDLDQQRLDLEKQKRDLERSLEESKDHLKKWNLRLDKISDEREHGALQSEIGGQKRAISRLEYSILEVMEQLEELEKKLAAAKQAFETSDAHATEELAKVAGDLKELDDAIATDDRARSGLVGKLPPAVIKKYERIAERRQGMGVAIIHGEVCGACHTSLPPQLCLQVYKGAILETCPSCSRILVHEAMTRSEATDSAQAEGGASA